MHITPILPKEALENLPILALKPLYDNQPMQYTGLQEALIPYLDSLHLAWWACLLATMAVLIVKFIMLPLLQSGSHGGEVAHDFANLSQNTSSAYAFYRRVFFINEIEQDLLLRWFGGAILLGLLAEFNDWQLNVATTVQGIASDFSMCWPFFQSCQDYIFLDAFPYAHSQMIFFMGLFALIVLAAYALTTGRIIIAHICILLLFFAKIYLTLINAFYNGNYDYYNTVFCIVFLFLPHKRFFASLSVAMLYTLSTVVKIHPSWTAGLYFTAMKPGMPIFPNSIVPIMTNLVIFMEMVMAWFLFSKRQWLQRSVLVFFILFHIYSGTLVGYHYPSIVLPALIVCFGTMFTPFVRIPLDRKSIIGWAMMAMLWVLQIIPLTIEGDAKLTLEGNFFGLYMFEANHQCDVNFIDENGGVIRKVTSTMARFRCDPWSYLFNAQKSFCKAAQPPKIRYSMIHSINGGPFYEIINEPDMCQLSYKAFSHNAWIKDATKAPMVGLPVQNYYQY